METGGTLSLPSLEDIKAAQRRIERHVHRTPLLSSRFFAERSGARVHLKAENLQRAGSFKIRGALNAILRAREEGRLGPEGVLTYSSGNHGQGVALAARIAGCPALVVVPEDILGLKRAAIEGYGARVVACGRTTEERRERGEEIARESGALVIPPFDHPDVIAGQGTVALEALADLPEAEVVLVPIGGGGLMAGIAVAARGLSERVAVFGVEPDTADSMHRSMAAGRQVTIAPSQSIADGLRAVRPGALCLAAALAHLKAVWLVSDASIRSAQRDLLERAKLLVEPSGAATVAALAEHRRELSGRTVVAVLSGGNAEAADLFPGPLLR
jgi:threonine dehydratase